MLHEGLSGFQDYVFPASLKRLHAEFLDCKKHDVFNRNSASGYMHSFLNALKIDVGVCVMNLWMCWVPVKGYNFLLIVVCLNRVGILLGLHFEVFFLRIAYDHKILY